MTFPEILMLRQSRAFVQRLACATRKHGDTRYHLCRRINWYHRYAADFYQREAALFTANVDAYVGDRCPVEPLVDHLEARTLGRRTVLVTLAKVLVHWLFLLLGKLALPVRGRTGLIVYRKAYVDDIELVYDVEQPSVLRAVYPFPVSVRRQLRYLGHLRHRGYPWRLAGNPYDLIDVLRFLRRRDLRSLQRLESRAQIRGARSVVQAGFHTVQLSDEFDLGSLDFCRTLRRYCLHVVNSAHGVGKYLPVHAYQEFRVLTDRQREYYLATGDCSYIRRLLNGHAPRVSSGGSTLVVIDATTINLVFLSGQTTLGIGESLLVSNEAAAFRRLGAEFGSAAGVRLLYRPHPNHHNPAPPSGFELLAVLEPVNGRPNTVFVSYNSTCQIDPAFQGRKILIRGQFMCPEIWFDTSEEMMDLDQLVAELHRLGREARDGSAQPGDPGPQARAAEALWHESRS
jgi:hypothetical protein